MLIFYRYRIGAVAAWLLVVASLVIGCQRPIADQPAADQSATQAPLAIPPDAHLWIVDPEQSRLLIKVYRGGRLAEMGHNHVISSRGLEGELHISSDILLTAAELRLPVYSLEVDRPEQRAAAGDEFPGELDANAITGTRANMLGERQLDAANWPTIILRSRGLTGELAKLRLQADLAVRDSVAAVEIPVVAYLDGKQWRVKGRFAITQTELGLEPFSVMLGALKVQDQLDIEFEIVADRR
jgi:hypothetical protein